MKYRRLYLILALVCCCFNYLFAQQIKFKPITTREGLSNNSVNDLISDKYGRLWIATWDGLNVYNGTMIKVFKHEVKDTTSISGNVIMQLLKDHQQNIWLRTDNQSVSLYLGDDKFQQFHFAETPLSLALTKEGRIAVEMRSGYKVFEDNAFRDISKDYIKNSKELEELEDLLLQKHPKLIVNDIFKDSQGNIWYATSRNGLYIIPNTPQNVNNHLIEHYTLDLFSPYSFSSNEIAKIYQDVFGNIWLAHKDGGISMAYKGSEQITTIIPHPEKYPHLPYESIRAIVKDNQSTLWLGYYNNGLFYYDEQTECFMPYRILEAESDSDWNRIRSLYTDSKGAIWAGTYNGLIKITPSGYKLFDAENIENFPSNRNYAFLEDNQHHLWVAGWGGLGKMDLKNDTFKSFPYQEELDEFHIRDVFKDEDTLVLATEKHGVLFFSEKQSIFRRLNLSDGILGNSIYKLHRDEYTGFYWIATLGGVSIYDPGKGLVKNITEAEGLPSHMVYGLLENENKMWLSTTKGIATIDKNNYKVSQLPQGLGLQTEEFSEGAAYQDRMGILFFGGIRELSYFQPEGFEYFSEPPKLHLSIDGTETFDPEVTKDYRNNSLSVYITPISYSGIPFKVYYRLKEFDEKWRLYHNQEIIYNNLQPGDYVLQTRIEGEKEEALSHLRLNISTPFYRTIWFYLICVLGIIALVSFIIFRKNASAKRIQRKMETIIQERTCIIEVQKENLKHVNKELEIRHKKLKEQKKQVLALHHQMKNRDFEVNKFKIFILNGFKPKLSKMLTDLNSFASTPEKIYLKKELLGMVQTLSEWNYLDQISSLGKVAPSQVHFKKLIQAIYLQVKPRNITFDAAFEYHIANQTSIIAVDVLRVKLLFQYLLNELLKYSDTGSFLSVHTQLEDTEVRINVKSTSELLLEQWASITKYSPYYKAFETLLKDLNGSISSVSTVFSLAISIPVVNVHDSMKNSGVLLLKHLEDTQAKKTPSILVYCDAMEMEAVHHLLKDIGYQLLFEHQASALPSALQQVNVKALVVYNQLFSNEFVQVIDQQAFKRLPSLFIAERIDLEIEEKVMDHEINAITYLPVDPGFLSRKVKSIMRQGYDVNQTQKSELLNDEGFNITVTSPDEKLVNEALEYIRTELGNPNLNVDKLITHLAITRTKCYRVFKEILQQSPSEVIISLRLQKAEQLLLTERLNISELSFECGFNDPKYFSRIFKKHFGASPKYYKKKQQE